MRAQVLAQYYMAMERIEAQEYLLGMAVADHPHNKPETRRKLHKRMHEIANPSAFEHKPITSMEQLAGLMMGGKRG